MKEKNLSIVKEASFERLCQAVEDDFLFWPEDDILNAPIEVVEAALERVGVAPRDPARMPTDIDIEINDYDEEHTVARRGLIDDVAQALLEGQDICVTGPRGIGKSHFVRNCMLAAREIRIVCPKILHVDAAGLRMPSPFQIEVGAVYAHFGENEAAFREFMLSLPDNSMPLQALIQTSFFAHRGLVVFDHIEDFSRSPETQSWLGAIVRCAHKAGSRVMLVTRGGRTALNTVLRISPGARPVSVPAINNENISRWLQKCVAAPSLPEAFTSRRIRRFTGGWPRLMRGFDLFLQSDEGLESDKPVLAFARKASRAFSPELAALIGVLRKAPAFLHRPLDVKDKHLVDDMLETGAIVERADGSLGFQNPIFAQRFRHLSKLTTLRVMALIGQDNQILSYRGMEEITGQMLQQSLMLESHPWRALKRLRNILQHFGVSGTFFIRDRENSKLWSEAKGLSSEDTPTWPLYADERPNFARAVQSGRMVISEGRNIYLPNTGDRGRVDALFEGKLDDSFLRLPPYDRAIHLDIVEHIVACIQPAWALAVERYSAIRAERLRRKAIYRSQETERGGGQDLGSVLSQVGCSAILVLERGSCSWFPSTIEQIPPATALTPCAGNMPWSVDWRELASQSDCKQLDNIANHPSRRGLVMQGQQISWTFPAMAGMSDTLSMFFWPAWMHGHKRCRMIVFVFTGDDASHIAGWHQTQLSLIAPLAARLAN